MFFVLKDVAVPDVFLSASSWTDGVSQGCCRQVWQVELHDDGCGFTWIYSHRFFPSKFVWIRRRRRTAVAPVIRITGERLTLNELNVHEVEMDG